MVRPSSEHDRDMAARFVARMDGENWGEADEAELQLWLDGSHGREGLLLQTHAAWIAASPVAEAVEEEAPEPAFWNRRRVLGAMAASVAVVAGAAHWMQARSSFATRLGEIRRVPLADGSVMTINSGSELTVRMAARSREIEIAQGEAWFDVAKDASRPFVVSAGKVRARAVGTAFSVRRRETGVEVLVTEGVVESWAEGNESLRLRLVAGERALLSEHAVVHHESDRASAVDRSLAWRNGMIDLNGTSLSEAADEFNRYNQRQIIIADASLADEEFDGLFRINDPQGFAEAVQVSLGVQVDMHDPAFIRLIKK
ncbi:iron dicitrate transport regulator FecR [Novosphingobium umbonatum]|uniref:Iron dicitrate transport regulator FecR n=1 Tax=Novosphingobium umbonatum TaxID=1908524 RepID=A0A3S2USY7_9SPHN|nr:FecR domain-containing protein [Novosphingobium umbonatum]RVU04055.1 iron dicitrate transport regulator FecR [Novosphingobium umbonatum]